MKRILTLFICLVIVNLALPAADSNPTASEAKYYENAKVIRVKYSSGETFVKRSYDEGLEQATVNLPVFEKDKIGTTSGRLELYLGRSNYLRLDHDSEIEFSEIPVLRKTNLTMRILKGGIYLDVENMDREKDIEIQTPDCGIFLLDRGLYRINVNESGQTEVYVIEGIAEVAGDNTSLNVRANQKTVMSNGSVRERPFYFQGSDRDEFDEWNNQRNRTIGYSRQSSSRYLESGYEDYEYELSRSGRWIYESEYTSYVWIPYNIGSSWRPYWHGRWIWNPHYGHTWTSYDPWGWYTHHYGRWHWSAFHGWYWIPGYHWSPAWVSWFWNPHYYGWCPLSYWNRPLIVLNKRWLRNYHHRKGMPVHSRSNTIIRKNQLSAANIHKVALKRGELDRINSKTLAHRNEAPRDRLTDSRVNVTDARGRSVQYKRGGIVSASRTNANNRSGAITHKYSRSKTTLDRPFSRANKTSTSRTSYRSRTTKSYRSSSRSIKSSSYKTYQSRTRRQTGKSTRSYSPTSKKRSTTGTQKTKRKKGQSYFRGSTSSTGQNTSSNRQYTSSTQKRYSSSSKSRNTASTYYNNNRTTKTYKSQTSRSTSRSQYQSSNRSYQPSNSSRSYKSRTPSSSRTLTSRSYSSRNSRSYSPSRSSSQYRSQYRSSSRSSYTQPRSSYRSSGSRSRSSYQSSGSRSRSSSSRSRSSSSRSSSRSSSKSGSGRKKG